eukprot:768530-Prorocentrum_minimum.AAC.1
MTAGRTPRGHYALNETFSHWRARLPPPCFADAPPSARRPVRIVRTVRTHGGERAVDGESLRYVGGLRRLRRPRGATGSANEPTRAALEKVGPSLPPPRTLA